ncbi:MAG TPA: HAMP domain-containing sensor histidine kinase [Thermoanaerobaculia bacterium]|nr:HAMP domain-containing sensor histidine kinase [Thermoanaerobaculia bacterium]
MSRTVAVTLLLLALACTLFYALHRSMADAVLAFGAHPEVVEALEASLDDQKELARLDPSVEAERRERFDEVQELLLRLRVLELNRQDILRRYEALLVALFLASAALAVGFLVWRQRRQEPRLARLQAALTRLAAGEPEVRAPDRGRDAVGRIAAMIERTSRRMAADRRRLAALQGLSAWQSTARQQVHELRTPLTAARLAAERLRAELTTGGNGDGEAAAAAERGEEELARLGEQARRLAEFARLPPPQPARSDLAALAAEFANTYRDAWPGTDLSAGGGGYEGGGEIAVEVDRDLLRQVLVNLCENASQAGAGRIELRAGGNGAAAELVVADDGPGVPPALAGRVFEPYVTSRGDGSGLGLAICRKILLDHGGDLELAETAGGAAFRLTLPRATGDADGAAA